MEDRPTLASLIDQPASMQPLALPPRQPPVMAAAGSAGRRTWILAGATALALGAAIVLVPPTGNRGKPRADGGRAPSAMVRDDVDVGATASDPPVDTAREAADLQAGPADAGHGSPAPTRGSTSVSAHPPKSVRTPATRTSRSRRHPTLQPTAAPRGRPTARAAPHAVTSTPPRTHTSVPAPQPSHTEAAVVDLTPVA